jgi:hypothetical protein
MDVTVPRDVLAVLRGDPAGEGRDPFYPLLTVDAAGFPHPYLLSRAQLTGDDTHVRALVSGRRTIANLTRTRTAALLVVCADAVTHLKLSVERLDAHGRWLACTFRVADIERNGVGAPLSPPSYQVTTALVAREDWDGARRLLDEPGTEREADRE